MNQLTIAQMLTDLKARDWSRRDISEETGLSQATLSDLAHGKRRAGIRSLDGIAQLGACWAVASVNQAVAQENDVTPLKAAIVKSDVQLETERAERWLEDTREAVKSIAPVLTQQALYDEIRTDEQDRPPLADIHPHIYDGTPCTGKRLRNIVIACVVVALTVGLAIAAIAKADMTTTVMQAAK